MMKYSLLCLLFITSIRATAEGQVVLDGNLEWRICPTEKPIKGNINFLKNTKIYHLPGGNSYKRTNPEMCFSSEQEAESAGFRKSEK